MKDLLNLVLEKEDCIRLWISNQIFLNCKKKKALSYILFMISAMKGGKLTIGLGVHI